MQNLLKKFREPTLERVDENSLERIEVHRMVLDTKPLLKKVFMEIHQLFQYLDEKFLTGNGLRLEVGAGVTPMRDSYSDVLATDIVQSNYLDLVIDAENIPYKNSSIRTIFAQNCFHHLPNPRKFFQELSRVLSSGGGAIILEPYYGLFASFLYKRLFTTEGFDKGYPCWEVPINGPMNGANQALSYIVFVRDAKIFEKEFPDLEIIYQKPCNNYLMYLVSGGLNFAQITPNWANIYVEKLQKLLLPFNRLLALHHVIVIRKK